MQREARTEREWGQWPGRRTADQGGRDRLKALFTPSGGTEAPPPSTGDDGDYAALSRAYVELDERERRVVPVVAVGRQELLGAVGRREERLQAVAASLVRGPPSRPLAPFPLRARLSLHPVPPVVMRRRPSSAVEIWNAAGALTLFRGFAGGSCPKG